MNLLTALLKPITILLPKKKETHLYGLDHAILNIALPPETMWMNMGYWEVCRCPLTSFSLPLHKWNIGIITANNLKQETTLPAASRALLDQVLITAGLFDKNYHPGKKINMVDVGFGCGDQSLYLLSGHCGGLVEEYIGVNDVCSQVEFARQRLVHAYPDMMIEEEEKPRQKARQRIRLFHADAANPSSWSSDLKRAVSDDYGSSSTTATDLRLHECRRPETWVLALDTMYHFQPSRRPFLGYACSDLQASLMAFDLAISDSASMWNRLLLRIICWVTGTPFANFLTRREYEDMLVAAGYSREHIQWRDISEHVFGGIAGFIRRREEELRKFNMGIGKFKGAGYVFDWWARSGLVRGVVVVARKE